MHMNQTQRIEIDVQYNNECRSVIIACYKRISLPKSDIINQLNYTIISHILNDYFFPPLIAVHIII